MGIRTPPPISSFKLRSSTIGPRFFLLAPGPRWKIPSTSQSLYSVLGQCCDRVTPWLTVRRAVSGRRSVVRTRRLCRLEVCPVISPNAGLNTDLHSATRASHSTQDSHSTRNKVHRLGQLYSPTRWQQLGKLTIKQTNYYAHVTFSFDPFCCISLTY